MNHHDLLSTLCAAEAACLLVDRLDVIIKKFGAENFDQAMRNTDGGICAKAAERLSRGLFRRGEESAFSTLVLIRETVQAAPAIHAFIQANRDVMPTDAVKAADTYKAAINAD